MSNFWGAVQKPWFGLFTESPNKFIEDWSSDEVLDNNRKINLGYGEYENQTISRFSLNSESLKTEYGYAVIPIYFGQSRSYTGDLFLLNKGKIYCYYSELAPGHYNKRVINWYNGSVLFGYFSHRTATWAVVSPEGKELETIEDSYDGLSRVLKTLSYTDAIRANYNHSSISRYNYKTKEEAWSTPISDYPTIQNDARVTPKITDKDANTIIYELDIVNRDGSRQNFKCEININTGSVRVL